MKKILCIWFALLWYIPMNAGNTRCTLLVDWYNTTTVEFYQGASKTYNMSYSGGSVQVVFYTPSSLTTSDAQMLQTNIRDRIASQGYSSWLSLTGVYPGPNKFMVNFSLKANTSGATRELVFYTQSWNTATILQPSGEPVHSIINAGTYKMLPDEKLTITLDGYTSGTTYHLYRDGIQLLAGGEILSGNSGLRFTVATLPGTYSIRTSSGTQMNGYVVVKNYEINTTAALRYHTDRLELDKDGGILQLICPRIGNNENVIEELEEIIRKCQQGLCADWTGVFQLSLTRYDTAEVEFSLVYGANTGNATLTQTSEFAVQVGSSLKYITFTQPAGGGIALFDVDYELLQDNYARFNITLSGSQPGMRYVLKREETQCGEATGTGGALTFENLTTQGNYTIYAMTRNQTVRMNGTAEVFDTASTLSDGNRIRIKRFIRPGRAESVADVTYFDGLGFLAQEVSVKASPEGTNLITPYYYDELRRDNARSYLPYVSTSKTGEIATAAFTDQQTYYGRLFGSSEIPYSENRFEASPLNRVVRSYSAGEIFRTHDKYAGFSYATNATNEVKRITQNATGNGLTLGGYYAAGQLFKERVENEDSSITETFRDKLDRIVLTRNFDGATTYDTYCIYDDMDNLCYVLPPKLSASLGNTSELTDDSDIVTQLAYIYKYDDRNRIIQKKLPGAEPVYLIYDKGSRLVLLQDGNLREQNRWVYNVYDNFGNIKSSNLVTQQTLQTRDAIQTRYDAAGFDNSYPVLGDSPNLHVPFSDGSFSLLATLSESHYGGDGFSVPETLTPAAVAAVVEPPTNIDNRTCGLKIYDRFAILDSNDITEISYVERAYYYDYEGRIVQRVEKNPLAGISRTSNKYDFSGNVLTTVEAHEIASQTNILKTEMIYDRRGRLRSEYSTLDDKASAEIHYAYDGLGRLVGRTTNDGKLSTSQSFNLQGWPTGQKNTFGNELLFSSYLRYYDRKLDSTTPSYTGNISEWTWQHANDDENTYIFNYDKFTRLTDAKQYTAGITTDHFVEKGLTYDPNGNVLTLQRTGSGSLTNDFSYTYAGNRLTTLSDRARDYSYAYDANGNMTYDGANNLDIAYNCLNMIQKVEKGGTLLANYSYLTDSTKFSAVKASGEGLYYLGSLVYKRQNNKLMLESATFSGGRFVSSSNGIETHYFVTDHLGSVRVVVNSNGKILECNNYYPFGKRWDNGELSENRYRYNGKEIQTFVNLPYTDYGARQYDPDSGIWHSLDPLAEKYRPISPYAYCANNPIKYVDSDGRLIGTLIGTIVGGVKGAYDAYKDGTNVWAGAAEGMVSGAITGAVVDAAIAATVATGGGALVVIGAGTLAGAAGGAVGAIAGDVTGQVITNTNKTGSLRTAVSSITTDNFADKAKNGAISGAVSGLSGGAVGLLGKAATTSTKAVQKVMSKNITTTATILTEQGASQEVIDTAISSITKGMSTVGRNTANTMIKIEATVSTVTETGIKAAEAKINKVIDTPDGLKFSK